MANWIFCPSLILGMIKKLPMRFTVTQAPRKINFRHVYLSSAFLSQWMFCLLSFVFNFLYEKIGCLVGSV